MAKYLSKEAARDGGFEIEHRPDEHQFVINDGSKVVGFAHYTLNGDEGINFDSTVVDESLRGTGLSGLLVARALGDSIVKNRSVQASCWFVAGYIDRHADSLADGAVYLG